MEIVLTKQQLDFVKQQVETFNTDFAQAVVTPVRRVLQYKSTLPTIQKFQQGVQDLQANLDSPHARETMSVVWEGVAPMLKLVMLARRRTVAADVDARKEKTTNPEVIANLDEELSQFDSILEQEWAAKTDQLKMPHVSDFLTLEEVEKVLDQHGSRLAPRQYDEKFHLLQAPTLLSSDLSYYREVCNSRGISLALAHLDIDDFKKLNTTHGHVAVDKHVLPVFMRALERFAFARGHAYRFGGDEYVVLLPNGCAAEKIIGDLLLVGHNLAFGAITENITLSIGLCVVDSDSSLTNAALLERANRAMRFAKDKGKNRVATFRGKLFREEDLFCMPLPADMPTNSPSAGTSSAAASSAR